ncbi:MAG: hypothetical protein QM767_29695 [Anaeromyxobacter sp.]
MSRAPLALALCAALLACAPARTPALTPASRSGPWSFELVDAAGRALPTFQHQGRTYVLGQKGQRYLLRFHNGSAQRVEVVASVDGRDVVDGRPASVEKRGYLVDAWGTLTVDGFRLSQAEVAAFRFSSVSRSYAARMGDARDVGVIGVAVFPERPRPVVVVPRPHHRWEEEDDLGLRSAPAPQAEADASGPVAQAPAAPPPAASKAERSAGRPGLGTEFGEAHTSAVEEVPFDRASDAPAAVLTLRYDDRRGLAAVGIDVDRRLARADDRSLRDSAQPFRGSYAEPPPGW